MNECVSVRFIHMTVFTSSWYISIVGELPHILISYKSGVSSADGHMEIHESCRKQHYGYSITFHKFYHKYRIHWNAW